MYVKNHMLNSKNNKIIFQYYIKHSKDGLKVQQPLCFHVVISKNKIKETYKKQRNPSKITYVEIGIDPDDPLTHWLRLSDLYDDLDVTRLFKSRDQ